jgi:hypothetical protein
MPGLVGPVITQHTKPPFQLPLDFHTLLGEKTIWADTVQLNQFE